MLEAKLTPCATMLYHWILRKFPSSDQIKIDLQDFQAWTGEYRDKAYSDREVFDAMQQLKQNHLVTLGHTEVTLGVRLADPKRATSNTSLPRLAAVEKKQPSDETSTKRPHPILLISLVTLTSFMFGSIPIALGLLVARSPEPADTTHLSGKPETVLVEKQIQP